MNMLYFVLQHTMLFMIPLMIVALGGLFSEKSGVVNIALEGKMILGAFSGMLTISLIQDSFPDHPILSGQPLLLIALLIALATGVLVSLLHAYASISLKANQVISGIAINMFAPAFAIYNAIIITGTQNINFTNQFRISRVPLFGDIPVIGPMLFQNTYITTYLGFLILAIGSFVIYKTKFGLRLRACGEHPGAADSVGISVAKMRYAGVIISGALAGIGGVILVVPAFTVFSGTVSGYGFLALAVLIFGGWNPIKIIFAAFFFGLMQAIAASYAGIANEIPVDLYIFGDVLLRDLILFVPGHFYRMFPYVVTLILLAFTSKKTIAPKALGIPYDKGQR